MAKFTSLASELLANILDLSTTGESTQARQASRHSFSLISRGCFLATAGASDWHVAGEKQAIALVVKLEREKKWMEQEERKAKSGRITRASLAITRVSNIRRLSFVLDGVGSTEDLATLLIHTPNLIKLDLDADTNPDALAVRQSLPSLETALGGLGNLIELRIQSRWIECHALVRILIPLTNLEVLALAIGAYDNPSQLDPFLSQLSLPHLRDIQLYLFSCPPSLFSALATSSQSSRGIQLLDLIYLNHSTPYSYTVVDPFISHVSTLTKLKWVFDTELLKADGRERALDFIAAMRNLESITLSVWPSRVNVRWDQTKSKQPIDSGLLDTLATLPALRTVKLVVNEGDLAVDAVIALIKSCTKLQAITLKVMGTGQTTVWTQEQRKRVEEAAEEVGVAFRYDLKWFSAFV